MHVLNKLVNVLRRRSEANRALLLMGHILEAVLEGKEYANRYESVRAINRWGEQYKRDFRKEMLGVIVTAFEQRDPRAFIRKRMILTAKAESLCRLLMTEKFYERRETIYNWFNKESAEPKYSDQIVGEIQINAELECVVFRLFQLSWFRDASKKDWWTLCVQAADGFHENLFAAICDVSEHTELDPAREFLLKSWPILMSELEEQAVTGDG